MIRLVLASMLLAASLACADEAKKPEPPSIDAILSQYSNYLWQHRNALEQELAQARAEITILRHRVEELTKPKVDAAPPKPEEKPAVP